MGDLTDAKESEQQPPLTVGARSFTRGSIGGVPCVVIYDAGTDKTTVIAKESKWYANAMAALTILETCGIRLPLPKSAMNSKTIVKPSRLILPGSNASN